MYNPFTTYFRKREGRFLVKQIARLHPELDAYQGDDKINRYAVLTFRLVPQQLGPTTGQKLLFNQLVADQSIWLRNRVLTYISVLSPAYYHGELLRMSHQNQTLNQQLKELLYLTGNRQEASPQAPLITSLVGSATSVGHFESWLY